ncbi:hypothetical protein [Haloechinothrix salitolerans]|uniref:Uncharacterized protein n=1 Tax=Haloechinothrix salitolerans TaxID=926830 RepID=A0ABW2BYD1_9PSEU
MDTATPAWITLPWRNQPLKSVTHIGNGKHHELSIEFADVRRIDLATRTARIEASHGIVAETSPWGDTKLQIRYSGASLALSGGRIGFDRESAPTFPSDAQAWFEAGCHDRLLYTVDVELQLTSTRTSAP